MYRSSSLRYAGERLSTVSIWVILCLLTLGFSPKYRNRLRNFEALAKDRKNSRVDGRTVKTTKVGRLAKSGGKARQVKIVTKEMTGVDTKPGKENSMRAEQQLEWDRLSTAMSVITATSAAALAIPGLAGPETYWVISSCFCVALGLSLEGLMLVTYVSLVSAGASDEIIGCLANAIVMSLPAAFISYSSLFLLVGTFFMILHGQTGLTVETRERQFSILSLVPLSFGALVLIFVVLVCEAVLWNHTRELERMPVEEQESEA